MRSVHRCPPATLACCLLVAASLVLPAAGAAAGCSEPALFGAARLHAIGVETNRLELADLNGDGILDLVACGFWGLDGGPGNRIVVMLGTGDGGVGNGTFEAPRSFAVGSMPGGIVVADFDGDDTPDLVATSLNNDNVSFLHGRGDGTFLAPVTSGPCPGPYEAVPGDFDHDGILDLAVADNFAYAFSVLFGLGDGRFADEVRYHLGGLSLGIAAGDLNHDGNPDLVATEDFAGVAVSFGSSMGVFQSAQHYPVGAQPYDVTLHDLDRDGNLDLLIANSSDGGVSVLRGRVDGTFGAAETFALGSNVSGVVAGDFDGDAITDLAFSESLADEVVILKGGGTAGSWDGTFAVHSRYRVASYPLGLAAGDLDGNGAPDLAVSGLSPNGAISTLIAACIGPESEPGAPHLVSVRDVPNDEGGRVFLRWTRSAYDTAGTAGIAGYRVWRRLPTEAAALRETGTAGAASVWARPVRTGPGAVAVEYWEAIATLPAEQLEGYDYAAPTIQDSLADSNPFTAYFVTALSADPAIFYQSNVDSGYSVDNLSPPMPAPFVATYRVTSTTLRWGRGPATDVAEFRLYRGLVPGFTPESANLVVATPDTSFVDEPGAFHYKLEAVDEHGNRSPMAQASPGAPAGGGFALALGAVRPNPSPAGRLVVELVLPSAIPAQLELFDVGGRRLARHEVGALGAGPHTVELSKGLRIPAGRYVIRLRQAGVERTAGAVVLD